MINKAELLAWLDEQVTEHTQRAIAMGESTDILEKLNSVLAMGNVNAFLATKAHLEALPESEPTE